MEVLVLGDLLNDPTELRRDLFVLTGDYIVDFGRSDLVLALPQVLQIN